MLHALQDIAELHDLRLVLVAICVCAVGSWTTVATLERLRHSEIRARLAWLLACACVFGLSVWATHFIAIVAYHSPVPMAYDIRWSAVSIAFAVGLSALGFGMAALAGQRLIAGMLVGLGIVLMHYTGMRALMGSFMMSWDIGVAATSIAAGLAFATATFFVRGLAPQGLVPAIKTLLLALAVLATHFIGMRAMQIMPQAHHTMSAHAHPQSELVVVVGAVTLLIVALCLGGAHVDLYLQRRRTDERDRLRKYIGELEVAKAELSVALDAAFAANKSKSAFLAAMSHELRTPLNAILGFAELIEAEIFGPVGHPNYKVYGGDIRRSGAHLLSVINDILDISKLEARKAELIEGRIVLSALLCDAVAMVQGQADSAGLDLSWRCEADMPAIWGDSRRLKQVLLNLLSNAIKFTPAPGMIRVEARRNGGLEISISDTGIGIAPEDLPKAFESFAQIDNKLSRKYEGTGLGLPLARHLVELHGGSLELKSELHRGTVATIHLPESRLLPDAALHAPEKIPA